MTFISQLYSCPWKLQRATSHTIYIQNWKNYPLEIKCLYVWSCAVWGSRWDQNSHLFQVFGLLLSTVYHVKDQMTKIKRGPLHASHMLAPSSAPWQCFPGWASPLFPAPKGGSSTPAFGKPLLWGTDILPCPWKGRRHDTQGKRKCTPTHLDDLSISKSTTSCSRPSTVDNHNISHRMVY